MMADQLHYRVRQASSRARNTRSVPTPKVGEEIFEGTDYPRTWDAFVGQERAKAMLMAESVGARMQGRRMDHILLASGVAGIGKTSLAKLIASDYGTGLVEVAGQLSIDDVRPILTGMMDNDFLFIDEVHQLVVGGKAKAEWLLHLLQDGALVTKHGVEIMPKITVIAATTDAQKLPVTILGRFGIRPVLDPYSTEEATLICHTLAKRLGYGRDLPYYDDLSSIARASNGNPRDMRALLRQLANTYFSTGQFDLSLALEWAGVSADGLDRLAQDYLMVLLTHFEGLAGEKVLASTLGEPGGVKHTEQLLIQKGLITTGPKGRELTQDGVERAAKLVQERYPHAPTA